MSSGVHRPTVAGKLLSNSGPRTPLLQSDGQVQNVKSSAVYVFGDTDIVEDEEVVEFEMNPMPTKRPGKGKKRRSRKKSTNASGDTAASQPLIFERVIVEGDTLQNIAIKYGCQIAQLKRLNNIMTDQEFYALKTVKVPVLRHSLITELIAKENEENGTNMKLVFDGACADVVIPVTEEYYDEEEEGDEQRGLLVRTLSIRDAYSDQSKEAVNWLKKMDSDINKILTSTNTSKDTLDEVTQSLTSKRFQPLKKTLDTSCEMKRSTAVVLLISVAVIVPLVVLVFKFVL